MALTQSQSHELLRTSYGGSDPTYPSFLRPYYVRYNAVAKSRDLGSTDILVADLSGAIGSESGSNTLYFKVQLPRAVELRAVKRSTGASTDRFISIGILDGNRKPIPQDAEGYAAPFDCLNTEADESLLGLSAGTYYITVSSSQWQSIPYAITIFVGRYALLEGAAGGSLPASGRLPLQKIAGPAVGTAPAAGTLLAPVRAKNASGAAGGTALPTLALAILRGAAGGTMTPYGRLKATWRLSGTASGSDVSSGTLSSEAPYGGGYGY